MSYLIVIVTSETCPKCMMFRGNGIMGNIDSKTGKTHEYMSYNMLRKILDCGAIFLSVHYNTQAYKSRQIINISKFYKGKDNDIFQESCYSHEGNTRRLLIVMDHNEKPKVIEAESIKRDKGNENIPWTETVKNHIPNKLNNYVGPFVPAIFVTKKGLWEESLKKGSPLLLFVNNGYTHEVDGDYWPSRTHELIFSRSIELDDILKDIKDGTIKIEANAPFGEKKEKPKPEGRNYKMVYYDDPDV
jgi:hypothetical protein